MTTFFDDSLPGLASVIIDELGANALARGVALRDTSGRLCFFAADQLTDDQRARLAASLTRALQAYARPDRVIADANDFGASELLTSSDAISVEAAGSKVRLIDNRLVGADWLRNPAPPSLGPPRFVFASLKGGVGRSTALSIVASDAAARGWRVLAVDLDLEAPGLGAMLLDQETTPTFGMIDALVEGSLAPLGPEFLRNLVGPSTLTNRGRIDVLPAFGMQSLRKSGDVLAKLARAYGETVLPDGSVASVLDQIASIVDAVSGMERYDLVLVDARAGLHETAASALLGLGAEVLCFGLDEPQTFQGYQALFSHMRRYAKSREAEKDWLARLSMVHAKAPLDTELRADFSRRCARMISGDDVALEGELRREVPLPEGFGSVPWDDAVSDSDLNLEGDLQAVEVIPVLYDQSFTNFAPYEKRDQISERVYRSTFGALLDYVHRAVKRVEPVS